MRAIGRSFRTALRAMERASAGESIIVVVPYGETFADYFFKKFCLTFLAALSTGTVSVRRPQKEINFPNKGSLRVVTLEWLRDLHNEMSLRGHPYQFIHDHD